MSCAAGPSTWSHMRSHAGHFPPPAPDHERIRNLDWRVRGGSEQQCGKTEKTRAVQEPPKAPKQEVGLLQSSSRVYQLE